MIRIKESNKRFPYKVETWLKIPDKNGNTGLQYLDACGVYFVHSGDANIGLAWNGESVKKIPKKNCILFRSEPPIYNIFYGWNNCNPKYVKKFYNVLSIYKYGEYPQVNFLYPDIPSLLKHINTYFNLPKEEMLCMVLKNKKGVVFLNSLIPKLKQFEQYSNMKMRVKVDKMFCDMLACNNYHSYGRGWDSRCFKGKIKGGITEESILSIVANHKFNFCPENSCFEGFITEKPMRAMCCGSIPIYLGAPDVEKYLPEGTYIDLRNFDSTEELVIYLKELTESEIEWYRDNIYKFVTSKKVNDLFSSVTFAKKLIKCIEGKYDL